MTPPPILERQPALIPITMVAGQSHSDFDDRTTSALSTSSHTHVDFNDAHPQSPQSKMTTSSAKQVDAPAPAIQVQSDHHKLAHTPETFNSSPMVDTAQVGRLTANRQKPADRPPPPKCMQSCLESIESCTQNVVRFNERMEQSRAQADAQRRENGDPVAARKAMIPMVFAILSWVFLVYAWRLCSRLIQQTPQGAVLGSRQEGIGLLTGFVVLWLMTIWSYVVVISKGPGLVKEYVAESDPPLATGPTGQLNGAAMHLQQSQQGRTDPVPIPGSGISAMHASESMEAAPAPSTSLPYPSFNADLERFGGNRASSDSMRVLPGSIEPKFSHSRDISRTTVVAEEAAAEGDTSVADVEAQLGTVRLPPTDEAEESDAGADPQLPGIVGPLAAAVVAEGEGARQGAQTFDCPNGTAAQQSAPAQPLPHIDQSGSTNTSGWPAPRRRPGNDPPPLSPAALYCHRCRRIKPPRAHHCRRCNTCILKMDHHCPWIGGCVGAHNQRFFFIFALWVTLLELYTLVTTAVCFHRSVSRGAGVDGFLISLFPICAMFLLFTGALLCTHVWLMARNMTTIEHVGVSRMAGSERVLVDRWFAARGKSGLRGFKEKRKMVKEWDREWGGLTREGNRWWLGGSEEIGLQPDAEEKSKERNKGTRKSAMRTNMEQALGTSVWMWFVPLGPHPNDGLDFPMNPRFGSQGVWRKRDEWPTQLR